MSYPHNQFFSKPYLFDVYRGETKKYNFLEYTLFVSFFPQLISGPIVRHEEIISQFSNKEIYRFNSENVAVGITTFSIGLFKKVVLVDHVATYANPVFAAVANGESINFLISWCGVLAYSLQLYFDFSGYSDMAIGAARMFGIKLPVNFNSPYKAINISDFWRRWHITLSNFLRDYLYIPLGGNRQGDIRRKINLIITMLLGGLWHGAGWNFVFWGGLHGTYLVIHRQWQKFLKFLGYDLSKSYWWSRGIGTLITFLSVVIAWIFFRAANMNTAFLILEGMSGFNGIILPMPLQKYLSFLSNWGIKFEGTGTFGFAVSDALIWIFSLLLIVWLIPNTQQWMENYEPALNYQATKTLKLWQKVRWQPSNIWVVISTVITLVAIFHISQDNEFIYFQF
ncbi:MAG: MBOAT family protein [Okeania sp. SIO3B3]|nr:MBOAT family protein [Okeania sp. SIO3B3]